MKRCNLAINIICLLMAIFFCNKGFSQSKNIGYASYYGKEFQGRKTSSGEKYDMKKYTAAHRTLPFGTFLKVTHLENSKSVVVKVNDRGPFSNKRLIDLSRIAAEALGMINEGVCRVSIEVVSEFNQPDSLQTTPEAPKPSSVSPSITVYSDTTAQSIDYLSNAKPGNFYFLAGKIANPKGYGIQVLSISDTKKVRIEVDSLKSKGFGDIYIEPKTIDDKKTYRIIVGEYSDKAVAEKEKLSLERNGYNGFVRRFLIK